MVEVRVIIRVLIRKSWLRRKIDWILFQSLVGRPIDTASANTYVGKATPGKPLHLETQVVLRDLPIWNPSASLAGVLAHVWLLGVIQINVITLLIARSALVFNTVGGPGVMLSYSFIMLVMTAWLLDLVGI